MAAAADRSDGIRVSDEPGGDGIRVRGSGGGDTAAPRAATGASRSSDADPRQGTAAASPQRRRRDSSDGEDGSLSLGEILLMGATVFVLVALAARVQNLYTFDSVVGSLFGGGSAGYSPQGGGDGPQVQSTELSLRISLAEAYTGVTKEVPLQRVEVCTTCGGDGAHPDHGHKECPHCGGRGEVTGVQRMGPFVQRFRMECEHCQGTGRVPVMECPRCGGKGMLRASRTVQVAVPPGVESGHTLVVPRAGNQHPGATAGDVVMRVAVRGHPRFERRGDDLHVKLSVSLREALLGFRRELEHLDGHVVVVAPTTPTDPGAELVFPGEGMPHAGRSGGSRGKLVVHCHVVYPKRLSAEQASGASADR